MRGKIKKKSAGYDGEGGSGIGSSEVVNGGRGRCEKSPRKKCARDEAKQRGGPAGFGGGEEFTNDGKSPETTQPALSFFFFF